MSEKDARPFAGAFGLGPSFKLEPLQKLPFIEPHAEHDIWRAINRHGVKAVREAIEKLAPSKRRRGRPRNNDLTELRSFYEADAGAYLAGRDPFHERSNYSIAKDIADKKPGQSHQSTMKRIQRRLKAKPHDRRWHTLVRAVSKGRENHPYSAYVRALTALCEIDTHEVWRGRLAEAERDLEAYMAKTGQPAPSDLSMKNVEDVANEPVRVNAMLRGILDV